jgi:hypothetical protein
MHAGLLHRSRSLHCRCRWTLSGLLVLMAFGVSVLDLPIHLLHHLDEVNPDCRLPRFAVSLSSSILDDGRLPTVDHTWNELIVPVLLPYVSLPWESPQARPLPPIVHSS